MASMAEVITTLERAFQLARSGDCTSMTDLAKALKKERHEGVESHLMGPKLRIQLRTIMMEIRLKRFSPG